MAQPQPGPSSSSPAHFPTFSYAYPSGQTPLSPLPKQLFMPPPEPYTPTPKPHSHPQPHVHTYGSQPASQQQTPPRSQQQHQPQSPSQPEKLKSTRRPQAAWAIWSRRPQDPTHAPGIIISPNAKPPPEVVQQAIDLPTPPPSPVFHTQELEHPEPGHEPEPEAELTPEPAPSSTVPSSSVTETTDRDTPAVGSPVSSATSLSASVDLATKVTVSVSSTAASPATASSLLPTSAPDSTEHQAQPLPTTAPTAPKKSWASLLQASASTSVAPGPGHKRLLASSVVGISVPASALLQPSQPPQPQFAHPALSLPHAKRGELLALLTSPPSTDAGAGVGPAPAIRPRGLINAGNMCFANSVLQVLVYCPPFLRLFTELARFGFGFRAEKEKDREGKDDKGPTPLVDAVVEFVREFSFGARRRDAKGGVKVVYKGKGKEREREASGERSRDEEEGASFLPSYVYDAMKEKTVFDGMRSGQQEDAEEFLGFFLDALEEELLAVIQALSPPPPPTPKKIKAKGKKESESAGIEEKEVEEEKEDGWLEVGKRNRMVVTRTIKAAETPITRIFGGKVRSTLKAPGQKDSVTVEAWRALRLDISPPSITSLPLALAHMAAPQALETPRQASMQHLLEALPPVLVVHLKRFCYDKEVGGVVKIGKGVRWGEGVEVGGEVMAPGLRRGPAARYRLFGVVYHHGQSASGGHYTLDVLHPARPVPEGWMRIDDELVSDLRPDDVFGAQDRQEEEGKAAYMLFYQRVR